MRVNDAPEGLDSRPQMSRDGRRQSGGGGRPQSLGFRSILSPDSPVWSELKTWKRSGAISPLIGSLQTLSMPAINTAIVARDAFSTIAKRENWAKQEAGVIVVFCIVFLVAVGVLSLFIHKKIAARRAAKPTA
ncbi:hypothetical protein BX600DRAFT_509738 [Xylariales sp. PMI_506]|nr:hypothetical protein BX600DRAFT_509738 [Xylariales sp. PMI_506]